MTPPFSLPLTLRWSDLDPNGHVRHSVYYDFGASVRIALFAQSQLPPPVLAQLHVGPILFREEAVFKREIRLGDDISIDLQVTKLRPDGSRFSIRHHITRSDGVLCAIINVDGAWIDTQKRKLTAPPPEAATMLADAPRSEDFEWI
jgi:acyl-CoA thioester hydrolase